MLSEAESRARRGVRWDNEERGARVERVTILTDDEQHITIIFLAIQIPLRTVEHSGDSVE